MGYNDKKKSKKGSYIPTEMTITNLMNRMEEQEEIREKKEVVEVKMDGNSINIGPKDKHYDHEAEEYPLQEKDINITLEI